MSIEELLHDGSGVVLMLTPQQLREFAAAVVGEMSKVEEPRKYTPREFSEHLGVTPSTLYRWRREGILKPYIVGKKIYYRDCDLMEE